MSNEFASLEETYFEAIRLFSDSTLTSMSKQTRVNILLLISEILPKQDNSFNLRQHLKMSLLSDAMWPNSLDPTEIELKNLMKSPKISPILEIRNKWLKLVEEEKKQAIRMSIKSLKKN